MEFSGWEMCTDVAQWQCFIQCDEGETLNPLRYCECIPEEERYDMFCSPYPISPPISIIDIIFDKPDKAGVGEICGGFNEFTGESFPDCEDGLVCESAGGFSIPGAGNVCKDKAAKAGLGETCGGFNEFTG